MKKILLSLIALTFTGMSVFAQYPDLPGPGGSFNPKTMPTGSYVIGMDNVTQAGGAAMNLRAYGLVVDLLNNNKKLKWVIKPGKALDGIDFNVNAQKMVTSATTTTTAVTKQTDAVNGSNILVVNNNTGIVLGMVVSGQGSIPAGSTVTAINGLNITISNNATGNFTNKNVTFTLVTVNTAVSFNAIANYNFKAGPFVVFQPDTSGIASLVAIFNNAGVDVNVYKTTADVSVDVRYDYFANGVVWKPKGAILDDGGNATIHEKYMTNASIPTQNYTTETTPKFVHNCYTFASEPHNTVAPDSVIKGIDTFVRNGGNFLAECAAVRTYEISAFARFQSTNGFDNTNENGDPATWAYSNADLSYFQINGYFGIADEGGSLKDWVIPQSPGNPPLHNFHYFTSGNKLVNGVTRPYTNASASKLISSTSLGGMVFYLGSHSYDGTTDYDINGQRMYLNAFLTPTDPQGSLSTAAVIHCAAWPTPVTVSCGSSAGPTSAYPLTFTLYEDMAPAGYGPEDVQLGNVVTFTASNTAAGGISTITDAALANASKNYVVAIRPASGCLQAKYLQAFCSTLPATLITFTADRNSSIVNLKWSSANEQYCDGYNIERKNGNGNWENIGFVKSQAPGGNSATKLNYSFNDINTSKTVTQYRVRQVDFDARSRYTEIRSVRGIDQKTGIIIYPNPTNDGKVNVIFGDKNNTREISVLDMSGRIVKQIKNITAGSIQIDNLTSGIYTLRVLILETGEQTVDKIVVQNR